MRATVVGYYIIADTRDYSHPKLCYNSFLARLFG
jgi:hypothetical protein